MDASLSVIKCAPLRSSSATSFVLVKGGILSVPKLHVDLFHVLQCHGAAVGGSGRLTQRVIKVGLVVMWHCTVSYVKV
jgi:hypothetical protein